MRRTPALYGQLRNPLRLICAVARGNPAKTNHFGPLAAAAGALVAVALLVLMLVVNRFDLAAGR